MISTLTHVDPTPQAESQHLTTLLREVHLGLLWKGLEAAPQLDHQTAGAGVQPECPIYVASALAQILHVGMAALDLERSSFSVGKQQSGCDRLAGFVVQDAPFQKLHSRAPV